MLMTLGLSFTSGPIFVCLGPNLTPRHEHSQVEHVDVTSQEKVVKFFIFFIKFINLLLNLSTIHQIWTPL